MQTRFRLNECANMSCLILDVHYENKARNISSHFFMIDYDVVPVAQLVGRRTGKAMGSNLDSHKSACQTKKCKFGLAVEGRSV